MTHRGPDGEGFYADDHITVGMRRLAIIDLVSGDQPLFDEQCNVTVVFNGEIYNHRELRKWLEERGHTLNSGSDGAVLPHLYEELGSEFLNRLNGIFAIALWDRRARRLLIARDKFGIKPLYWARRNGCFVFASELRSLLAAGGIDRTVDTHAIDEFLTFRFVPSPHTLFRAVRKLQPATYLVVTSGEHTICRYWRGRMTAHRRDRRELVHEYAEALERAVQRQLMSDRPLGIMLSGGVDSAVITAIAARHSTRVRTFTLGFREGADTNEIELARETARLFGAEHDSVLISEAEYLRDLPGLMGALEEPVGSSSALAVRYVSELMQPSVAVGLSGQGADEPLAGYWRHLGIRMSELLRPGARVAQRLAPLLTRAHVSTRVRRGLDVVAEDDDLARLMAAYALMTPKWKQRLYSPRLRDQIHDSCPSQLIEALRADVAQLDLLDQMLYVDTRFWLPEELLMIADKMSMATSLELRVPFLDEDLVSLVESAHASIKLHGLSRKALHKRAARRWLPARIVHRKERGWATPMSDWLRGPLGPLLDDVLLSTHSPVAGLFDPAVLRAMLDAHRNGERDHARELYSLMNLGLWLRTFDARLD